MMSVNSKRKQPMIISFSGIDGAGKSTQISRLRGALDNAGLRTDLVTFWDDVVALKAFRERAGHKVFKGDQGVGSPEAPIERRDKNVQSPLLSLARMAFYFLDALSLRRTVRRLQTKRDAQRAEVIIFDRFLYDELANLSLDNGFNRLYLRAMLYLAPRPDVAFVLDADPVAAFTRKPEYPLEFLHANRRAYLNLASIAGMTVIPASTIDLASAEILRHVQRKTEALLPGTQEAGPVFDRQEFAS